MARHRYRRKQGIKKRWIHGVIPCFLLLFLGSLLLDRKETMVRLAWLLDPMYYWLSTSAEGKLLLQSGTEEVGQADFQGPWQTESAATVINGNVQIIYGDGYLEEMVPQQTNSLEHNQRLLEELWESQDFSYLIRNFYIVNSTTYVSEELFPVEEMLSRDLSIQKERDNPKILIHHTHASEAYIDSRPGKQEDTVVGVGRYLAELLGERGYRVIHDTSVYDMVDGKLDRNQAYEAAKEGTMSILKKYPSVEVIIDLHRDSGDKRVTMVNGKQTAQIMFFNGLSRNMNGPIPYLYNPYLQDNLAFSLQMKLKAMEYWDDYAKPIFLKGYEYNLSILPRSTLVEVGTHKNTVDEAMNAMEPLAQILDEVLSSKAAE